MICWNGEPCRTRLICCAASRIMQTSTERSAAHTGRAPGNTPGPTGKRRRNPRHQMHRKIPSEISDSTVRALRGFCVSRNGDQISIIPFSFYAVYIVNPAVLFFAAKKSKSKMDILHNFSPFFTPQDWFDAPCFMICNKTAKSVAQCAKKTEKDLCGIFLTIVIYYLQ